MKYEVLIASLLLLATAVSSRGDTGMVNAGEVLLHAGADASYSAAIDTTTGYGYFGTSGADRIGYISMINLHGSTPTLVSSASENIPAEVSGMLGVTIDTSNADPAKHYLYVGTGSGQILKMSPGTASTPPQVLAILKPTSNGTVVVMHGLIDTTEGYAYLASYNCDNTNSDLNLHTWPYNQSIVARIALGTGVTFPANPVANVLSLQAGERDLTCGFLDPANGNIYFGTDNTCPAHVYEINVGDGTNPMTEVGRLDLNPGTANPYPPGAIADGVTHPGSDATQYGEIYLRSGIIDPANNRVYFGTDSEPGQVIQVNINQGKKGNSP